MVSQRRRPTGRHRASNPPSPPFPTWRPRPAPDIRDPGNSRPKAQALACALHPQPTITGRSYFDTRRAIVSDLGAAGYPVPVPWPRWPYRGTPGKEQSNRRTSSPHPSTRKIKLRDPAVVVGLNQIPPPGQPLGTALAPVRHPPPRPSRLQRLGAAGGSTQPALAPVRPDGSHGVGQAGR